MATEGGKHRERGDKGSDHTQNENERVSTPKKKKMSVKKRKKGKRRKETTERTHGPCVEPHQKTYPARRPAMYLEEQNEKKRKKKT